MTEENEKLRGKIKEVEQIASVGLAGQPDGDEKCRHHLMRALSKIGDITAQYAGLIEVECGPIEWDADGEDVDLPESVRMFVDQSDIPDRISDILSDRYGWLVKSVAYRLV